MLDKLAGKNLAVYVVWLPVLNPQDPATLQKNGAEAAKLIRDARVRFYSDPTGLVGAAYGKLMKVPHGSPAWDIYFVFGADAQWKSEPPKPQYWMHQLWDMDPKLLLKGPIFFEHVKKQLEYPGSSANRNLGRTSPNQIGRGNSYLPRQWDDGKCCVMAREAPKAGFWAELPALRWTESRWRSARRNDS